MDRPVWSSIARSVAVLAAASLVAWSLLSSPSPALADDSSVGGIGGDIYPLTNTDIRMESETVQAICYRYFAEYRVDFLFVNTGPAQTLMLGFPFALEPEGDGDAGPVAFRAWQDGKPLPVTLGQGQTGGSSQGYYLHQATFPAGRTMITVAYLADASWTSGQRLPELAPPEFALPGIQGQEGRYVYWLHTGAGWAGTIGTAVVRYTLADDFRGYGVDVKSDYPGVTDSGASTTRPETYSKGGDSTYQWVFKELEPTEDDDILLAFTSVGFDSGDSGTTPPALGAVVTSITTSNPVPPDASYPGWEAIDGSPGTALGLQGDQPWMRLDVQGDRKVQEIRIVPGKNDAPGSFAENARPKTIRVALSDGTSSVITLTDEPSLQKFPVSGMAEWVRVDIIDSYAGSKGTDTYISDVSFGNRPAPAFDTFDALIASTTSAENPSTTAPSPGAPPSSEVLLFPTAPSAEPAGPGDPGGRGVWTIWPIVALAVAGAALVTAIVLATILLTRRTGPGA